MTVKQLKEKIKDLPDLMDVLIYTPDGDFEYQLVNDAIVKEVHFTEGMQTPVSATVTCLVISDEF